MFGLKKELPKKWQLWLILAMVILICSQIVYAYGFISLENFFIVVTVSVLPLIICAMGEKHENHEARIKELERLIENLILDS